MPTLRSRFSGVCPPAVALVPVVVAVAFAAGPAVSTAGATAVSADVSVSYAGYTAVRNNGPSTAYNVKVTESWSQSFGGGLARFWGLSTNNEVPASCVTPSVYSVVFPNGSAAVTCTMPSLGPGQQEAIYARWEVGSLLGKAAAVTFTATSTSSTPDPNLANNTASVRFVFSGGGFLIG
jgi:Domain of unknown function DUF11